MMKETVLPEQEKAEAAFDELENTLARGEDSYQIAYAIMELIRAEIAFARARSLKEKSVEAKAAYAGHDTQAQSVAGEATPGALSSNGRCKHDVVRPCGLCARDEDIDRLTRLSDKMRARVDTQMWEIERLTAALQVANANHERFERQWYLRGDEIERLRAALQRIADEPRVPGGGSAGKWAYKLHQIACTALAGSQETGNG